MSTFTQIHVAISLMAIASGLVVLAGLLGGIGWTVPGCSLKSEAGALPPAAWCAKVAA